MERSYPNTSAKAGDARVPSLVTPLVVRTSTTARRQFSGVLVGLLLLVAVVLWVTEQWPKGRFAAYGPNLAVDLFSVFVAVFIVQRLLDWQRQRELDALRKVAANRLRRVLNQLINVLAYMFKAASERPNVPPDSVPSLIDSWAREVAHLDFAKTAPDFPERTWYQELSKVTASFEADARAIVDLYGEALGDPVIVRIEDLLATRCFELLVLAGQVPLVVLSLSKKMGADIPLAPPTSLLLGPGFDEGHEHRLEFATRLKALVEAAVATGADVSLRIADWDATPGAWAQARG